MPLPTTPEQGKPAAAGPQDDLAAEWRRLALAGYAAIDLALDSEPWEANAILIEAAVRLDADIDGLDALAVDAGNEGCAA